LDVNKIIIVDLVVIVVNKCLRVSSRTVICKNCKLTSKNWVKGQISQRLIKNLLHTKLGQGSHLLGPKTGKNSFLVKVIFEVLVNINPVRGHDPLERSSMTLRVIELWLFDNVLHACVIDVICSLTSLN